MSLASHAVVPLDFTSKWNTLWGAKKTQYLSTHSTNKWALYKTNKNISKLCGNTSYDLQTCGCCKATKQPSRPLPSLIWLHQRRTQVSTRRVSWKDHWLHHWTSQVALGKKNSEVDRHMVYQFIMFLLVPLVLQKNMFPLLIRCWQGLKELSDLVKSYQGLRENEQRGDHSWKIIEPVEFHGRFYLPVYQRATLKKMKNIHGGKTWCS